MADKLVRLSLTLTPEADEILTKAANKIAYGNKSDVLRRAIALISVMEDAKAKNEDLAIVDSEGQVVSKIIGL
jgi:Arc/MetJ-type ribon-helix-helix transcriptional regulator